MRNKFGKIVIIAMSLLMALALAACGAKADSLEDYYGEGSSNYEQLQALASSAEGVTIDVEENTLIYNFDISVTEDMTEMMATSDTMKESLAETLEGSTESYVSNVQQLEDETGIDDITIKVIYSYGDTELASKEYKNN